MFLVSVLAMNVQAQESCSNICSRNLGDFTPGQMQQCVEDCEAKRRTSNRGSRIHHNRSKISIYWWISRIQLIQTKETDLEFFLFVVCFREYKCLYILLALHQVHGKNKVDGNVCF
jgi:hypothetical protein